MSEFIISNANKASSLNKINDFFQSMEPDECFLVKIEDQKSKRSLNQNSLFHQWMRELAFFFSKKGADVDEDRMKALMKNKYLGTEDIKVNNTVIPAQLKETKKLPKGEMFQFMEKVDAWAADHGCYLSKPQDSEYMRLMERQQR